MKVFRLELRRLLLCWTTWLVIILSLACYFAGYSLYPMLQWTTMAVIYLANPISISTLGATILFSILTLYELNRIHKNHMDAVIYSILSPFTMILVQIGRAHV